MIWVSKSRDRWLWSDLAAGQFRISLFPSSASGKCYVYCLVCKRVLSSGLRLYPTIRCYNFIALLAKVKSPLLHWISWCNWHNGCLTNQWAAEKLPYQLTLLSFSPTLISLTSNRWSPALSLCSLSFVRRVLSVRFRQRWREVVWRFSPLRKGRCVLEIVTVARPTPICCAVTVEGRRNTKRSS